MFNKQESDLREMLVMEKFLETQYMDKARFIREREPENKEQVIKAADLFDSSRKAEMRLVGGKLFRPRNNNERDNKRTEQNNANSSTDKNKEDEKN